MTLLLAPAAAAAAGGVAITLPAGPLGNAIAALGEQADVTIGLTDPRLAGLRVRALAGRYAVPRALSRLLAGTTATYVEIDPQTFRIVARAVSRPAVSTAPPQTISGGDIVVTGSKRGETLATYAGAVSVVDPATFRTGTLTHGSEALLAQLPVLSATHLGPGRNKLFIRGVADSSFNGPSEATVGQYLGEVRLNYNAPDPDLALYDIASVEVLEGPQGTLYGAGSLGGIIRLVPNAPDLTRLAGGMSLGASLIAHGELGEDGVLVANVPIVVGTLAVRATAYQAVDGGYIDDPSRNAHDINRTFTRGGRATIRWVPAADWTIDLGGVTQDINSDDGQYAERGLPALQRRSVIAQPFDNDYALGDLVVRHATGTTTFVSATSMIRHDVASTYDASASPAAPSRYRENNHITLLTNETRLSHDSVSGGGWVIGGEVLRSADRLSRTLGLPGAEARIAGTRNVAEDASLFGEATARFARGLFATVGARIAYSRLVGHGVDTEDRDDEPHRRTLSGLPTAGLLWRMRPALALYARYQEGYRPGGLSIQDGQTQRFGGDSIATWELGLRYGEASSPLTIDAALSYAHWEDIQADLVETDGLPYTANIGTGRILGGEVRLRWRPTARLTVDGALFVNDSRLYRPVPTFTGEKDASLPNIADAVANAHVRYEVELGAHAIALSASANYVGRSRLGVGPSLDLRQGPYVDTAAGVSMPLGPVTLSLDATNLLDHRGNIFALGDPFGVMAGRQTTPLRPRTVRLGFSTAF